LESKASKVEAIFCGRRIIVTICREWRWGKRERGRGEGGGVVGIEQIPTARWKIERGQRWLLQMGVW
jgi:hypothetical protein